MINIKMLKAVTRNYISYLLSKLLEKFPKRHSRHLQVAAPVVDSFPCGFQAHLQENQQSPGQFRPLHPNPFEQWNPSMKVEYRFQVRFR